MDKGFLVSQLEDRLREIARTAHGASVDAADEARRGATGKEKKADARIAIEYAGLARGQNARAERAFRELAVLSSFRAPTLRPGSRIEVGALVEVDDEETGEGRTFFLAPVGAGITLTGPGGDGYLTVVTPVSPIGKAVLGRAVGDVIDVTVKGDVREWTISWVG
jgi:transcription elongation GreA/GreB family factor